MASDSTNINKTNNDSSPQTHDHEIDGVRNLDIGMGQAYKYGRVKPVDMIPARLSSDKWIPTYNTDEGENLHRLISTQNITRYRKNNYNKNIESTIAWSMNGRSKLTTRQADRIC